MTTAIPNRRDVSKYTATPYRAMYKQRNGWIPCTIIPLGLILLNIPSTHGLLYPTKPSIDFEHKTFTACSVQLKQCSGSDNYSRRREMCYMGYNGNECPNGKHFACGKDPKSEFLIEGCFDRQICPKGSSNRIRLNITTRTAEMVCENCDKDHYQEHPADSSVESLNGCSSIRMSATMKNQLGSLNRIEEGWPTRPDKYSCDVNGGYSDSNHQMYCFVNRPCHCTNTVVCSEEDKPDLLPDGTCDAKCAVDRNALANFTCSRYENPKTEIENSTQANEKQADESSGVSVGAIVGIVIGVLALIIFVVVIYWFCCKAEPYNEVNTNVFYSHDKDDNPENEIDFRDGHDNNQIPRNDQPENNLVPAEEQEEQQEEEPNQDSIDAMNSGDQSGNLYAQVVQETGTSLEAEGNQEPTDAMNSGDQPGNLYAQVVQETGTSLEAEGNQDSNDVTNSGDQPETNLAKPVQEVGKSLETDSSSDTEQRMADLKRSTDDELDDKSAGKSYCDSKCENDTDEETASREEEIPFIDDQSKNEEVNEKSNLFKEKTNLSPMKTIYS